MTHSSFFQVRGAESDKDKLIQIPEGDELSSLSGKQKKRLMKQQSPEFLHIVKDFQGEFSIL